MMDDLRQEIEARLTGTAPASHLEDIGTRLVALRHEVMALREDRDRWRREARAAGIRAERLRRVIEAIHRNRGDDDAASG